MDLAAASTSSSAAAAAAATTTAAAASQSNTSATAALGTSSDPAPASNTNESITVPSAPILSGFVEDYLDTLQILPLEVHRHLEIMGHLDQTCTNLMASFQENIVKLLQDSSDITRSQLLKEHLPEVHTELLKSIDICQEKAAIAAQVYELIDRHIQRLDQDLYVLSKFGSQPSYIDSATKRKRSASDAASPKKKKGRPGVKLSYQQHDVVSTNASNVKSRKRQVSIKGYIENQAPSSNQIDEPTYCTCQQISYGDMIACDSPHCPIEWFHYGCVGLKDAPVGKWLCPICRTNKKSH